MVYIKGERINPNAIQFPFIIVTYKYIEYWARKNMEFSFSQVMNPRKKERGGMIEGFMNKPKHASCSLYLAPTFSLGYMIREVAFRPWIRWLNQRHSLHRYFLRVEVKSSIMNPMLCFIYSLIYMHVCVK